MTRYDVLPFRIGAASKIQLSKELQSFYYGLALALSSGNCEPLTGSEVSTIPIDNRTIARSPHLIYGKFLERLKLSAGIVIVDTAIESPGIARGSLMLHLAAAIRMSLDKNPDLQLLIIVSELPPPGDAFRKEIDPYVTSGQLMAVDQAGETLPVGIHSEYFPSLYRLGVARARRDPSELLKLKSIRRFGHFKKFNNQRHVGCSRFFHDLSYCVPEVAALLRSFLDEHDGVFDVIFYEATHSGWLEEAILTVGSERNIPCRKVEHIGALEASSTQKVLLAVAAVDSGETIATCVRSVEATGCSITMSAVSVLSTVGEEADDHRRLLDIGGKQLPVTYFLLAGRDQVAPDQCELCKLGIPDSEVGRDDYSMLATYDIWAMAYEAGWRTERNVPRFRKPIPLVPDYQKLVEQNGAWISIKLLNLLKESGGLPPDPIILCPDEGGATVLADYLRLFIDVTVIKIPRSSIDLATEGNRPFPWTRGEHPTWYTQLRSAATLEVILLDEFNVSGGTRRGLQVIANSAQKAVRQYCCLIDFSDVPIASQESIALYRLRLRQSEPERSL